MVSLKLKFRPSTVEGKDGCLYYQVIYMRKVRQIATNYRIAQAEWDSGLEEVIVNDWDYCRSVYLRQVRKRLERDKECFKRVVKELTISDMPFTIDAVVDEFHRQSSEITLFSYMEKTVAKLWRQGQHRTSETYRAALNSFRKFREDVDVHLDEIDSEMLLSYEQHLRAKELALNTISFYMKRLRAVYNLAVQDGYVADGTPFRKAFTASEKTVKRAIPLKYVRKLKNMDLRRSPSKSFARDMFLFSFFTRGMAFVDMAYLQKKNLKDNVLTYRRRKTGQMLSVRWEECMQRIINRYSSLTSPYLIPIIKDPAGDVRKQYHSSLTLINHNLKAIGKELGLTLPLTMYVARHSWASIARSEGIPLSVISEGMGHDSEKTTQIYLASLETQVIDKANRKLLKLL